MPPTIYKFTISSDSFDTDGRDRFSFYLIANSSEDASTKGFNIFDQQYPTLYVNLGNSKITVTPMGPKKIVFPKILGNDANNFELIPRIANDLTLEFIVQEKI